MTPPRPFTIHVPDEVLTDLADAARARALARRGSRRRLAAWQRPRLHEGAGRILARTVRLAHARGDVSTGCRSSSRPSTGSISTSSTSRAWGRTPLPLLLSHGWPGSIVEFERLIPMLTDPARFGGDPADAFTVVAPSLPGLHLLVSTEPATVQRRADRRCLRGAHERRARLSPLRGAGRRLGRLHQRAARRGACRPRARHPRHAAVGTTRGHAHARDRRRASLRRGAAALDAGGAGRTG